MKGTDFDELSFFRAIAGSGARALLAGRRALVALGFPVLTADYDFWLHIDDIEILNDAVASFDLTPSRLPAEVRLAAEADRQLTAAEVAAYLDAPVSDAERADARALVAWFRRRYSTGAERLAYVRRPIADGRASVA